MKRFAGASLVVILAFAAFAGPAAAEKTISVNDNIVGIFDQPSAVPFGSVVHVAFIGDNTASGVFQVFYAAVNGAADFSNLLLARDNTVILTQPTTIDNTDVGNNTYFDARHPRIAVRSATEVVILFQARRTPADVVYRPYIARLTLANNAVTGKSVREVDGFPAGILTTGDIEDISFGFVTTDNTVRMAFAVKPAIGSTSPFEVWFARAGVDNALVVGTPIRLDNTALTGSDGFRPVPSLRLDTLARSHIAWAANDDTSPGSAAVYYALVKEVAGADNLAIGATFINGGPKRWSHPNVLVSGTSSVTVLAAHESVAADGSVVPIAGSILLAQFNPDIVPHDGGPARFATASAFYVISPTILDGNFVLFRPEAFLDSSGRIHLSGYGDNTSTATYYAITVSNASPFATFVAARTPVGASGSPEFPGEIGGDYTKAAFVYFSGKAVVFWSGIPGSSPARRNLDVSTVPTVTDPPPPTEESGCSIVAAPGDGEMGRIPGAALLFLPAAVLALRRRLRHGRPLSSAIRRLRRRAVAD